MGVTIPVPVPGAVINQSILTQLQTRGFFSGMRVFASLVEYAQATIPTEAAKPKYFASLSPIGIFIDGSLTLDGTYAPAFSDDSFAIYGTSLANFYRARAIAKDPEFATIPRLVIRDLPDFDKLNFSPDMNSTPEREAELRKGRTVTATEQAWALGTIFVDPTGPIERSGYKFRATYPTNMGLKFENGRAVAFDYQEYDRAYPIKTTVSVGSGGTVGKAVIKAGQEEAFLMAAGSAFFSPDKKAAANDLISKYVEVK